MAKLQLAVESDDLDDFDFDGDFDEYDDEEDDDEQRLKHAEGFIERSLQLAPGHRPTYDLLGEVCKRSDGPGKTGPGAAAASRCIPR